LMSQSQPSPSKEKYFEVSLAPQTASNEQLSAKRDEVMAERNRKLQERMAAMAQRRMKRSTATSSMKQQKEAIQEFTQQFTVRYDAIEDDIAQQRTYEQFKALKVCAFKLEQFLADNASILPSYTFEAKNKMMSNLKEKINQTQQSIAPKPKFVFSQKNKSVVAPVAASDVIDEDEKHNNNNNNNNNDDDDVTSTTTALSHVVDADEIMIENRQLETIYLANGSVNGSDVCLSNLINCTVSICDHIGALRMNHIKHCTIITGPISSSLHVEHLQNSTVNAIMRQCRIHHCTNSKFYIHVNSEPVIEHSDNVQFAPYNVRYKELSNDWKQSHVDEQVNQWNKVKDFNWFKQQQSPHWSVIPEHERIDIVTPVMNDDDDEDEL